MSLQCIGLTTVPTRDGARVAAAKPARAATDAHSRLREAVRLHVDLVWRVLRRAGLAAADAEDASQDVLWIFAQRFEDVPPPAQRSFLISTSVRVASDRRRSKWHRAVSTGLDFEQQESALRGADEQLELRRAARLFDRALSSLDEEDRAVYVLSELEELSRSEVAESLTIPKGTVASRLRRARGALALAVGRLDRTKRSRSHSPLVRGRCSADGCAD